MNHVSDSGSYFGWGWILWVGLIVLVFCSIGNWRYSYRAHRKYDDSSRRDDGAMLNERYASGTIDRAEYLQTKTGIVTK